jgi:UDPglucose 6-dehydrogenase
VKITMIGSGYVGLVSGTCLAEVGNDVLCLDVDARKIAVLKAGGVPIHEPGLQDMIHRNVSAGRLRFTTDTDAAVAHGSLQFIAVGTPPDEDGAADMRHVLDAAAAIGRRMTDYKVIVDKSTVPVGTADRVRETIASELAAERKRADAAIFDMMIVVGDDAGMCSICKNNNKECEVYADGSCSFVWRGPREENRR